MNGRKLYFADEPTDIDQQAETAKPVEEPLTEEQV